MSLHRYLYVSDNIPVRRPYRRQHIYRIYSPVHIPCKYRGTSLLYPFIYYITFYISSIVRE